MQWKNKYNENHNEKEGMRESRSVVYKVSREHWSIKISGEGAHIININVIGVGGFDSTKLNKEYTLIRV